MPNESESLVGAPARPGWQSWGWLLLPLLLYPFLPGAFGLYGPDEPRYAAIARAMAETGDFVTPRLDGTPWLEKPPLLYWLGALGYRLGLGPEAAPRLPVALLSVAFLFWWWRTLAQEIEAWRARLAALLLATSAGWVAYSNIAVTDVPLTVCYSAAMLVGWRWSIHGHARHAAASGALFGLGMLAKGLVPIALAVPLLWFTRHRWRQWPLALALALLVAAPWYLLIIEREGWNFIDEFFLRHHFQRIVSDALQHVQPFWFYLPVLLGLSFPWCFWFGAFAKLPWRQPGLPQFALVWAGWTLLFFSVATNKLPGYVLPAVPALTLLVALALQQPSRLIHALVAALTFAVLLAKLWLLPQFDGEWTARQLAAAHRSVAEDACSGAVPRALRYGLHYYLHRPLGECFEMPGAAPVLPRQATPPARLLVQVTRPTLSPSTPSSSSSPAPWRGRLLVLATREPNGQPILTPDQENIYRVWVASREVLHWLPGETVTLDPNPMSYPGQWNELPAGDWTLQVVFDPDYTFAAVGPDAADWVSPQRLEHLAPLESGPPRLLSFTLSQPAPVPARNPYNHTVPSPLLSRFHHQPITLQAFVEGPPTPERLLVFPGIGFDPDTTPWRRELANDPRQRIYLRCTGPFGHHAFRDSDVNGPWTQALLQELLPALERQYGAPQRYLLFGDGLGAYAAEWLAHSTRPTPNDASPAVAPRPTFLLREARQTEPPPLRNFFGVNLAARPATLFRTASGAEAKLPDWVSPRTGATIPGRSLQNDAHREAVLGPHGGRWESYEAILGPRTSEGISRQLFARGDGSFDPEVLARWLQREFRP